MLLEAFSPNLIGENASFNRIDFMKNNKWPVQLDRPFVTKSCLVLMRVFVSFSHPQRQAITRSGKRFGNPGVASTTIHLAT
jgi:hypothetical protein